MSNIYTSADQLIGHTPLLELTHLEKKYHLKAKLLAKLEYFNPAGSVKDRIAKKMQPLMPKGTFTCQKNQSVVINRIRHGRLQLASSPIR